MTDPKTPEEWQEAVDAAHGMLAFDSARKYGLVEGGPQINIARCETIITQGAGVGIFPAGDAIERTVCELLGIQRCRECGCTENNACPEGCWWVDEDLCSSCVEEG